MAIKFLIAFREHVCKFLFAFVFAGIAGEMRQSDGATAEAAQDGQSQTEGRHAGDQEGADGASARDAQEGARLNGNVRVQGR